MFLYYNNYHIDLIAYDPIQLNILSIYRVFIKQWSDDLIWTTINYDWIIIDVYLSLEGIFKMVSLSYCVKFNKFIFT